MAREVLSHLAHLGLNGGRKKGKRKNEGHKLSNEDPKVINEEEYMPK